MKKIFFLFLFILFGYGFFSLADTSLTREQFFASYLNAVMQDVEVPFTYKNISLKYKGLKEDTPLYDLMQKVVYYDLFPNVRITLPFDKELTQEQACRVIKRNFAITASCDPLIPLSTSWLTDVFDQIQTLKKQQIPNLQVTKEGYLDDTLLDQISVTLNASGKKNIQYLTIQNILKQLNDPYAVFFPPKEAQLFNQELQGQFEGIGAYVEMIQSGVLIIVSPIPGSPAYEAGLKAGDRILKINAHLVTPTTDFVKAVSWIKGKKGTRVSLLILREKEVFKVNLIRDTIKIKNVFAKTYSGQKCYLAIHMFGYGSFDEFVSALNFVFGKKKCTTYIFDVRNNPGGSLDEVVKILNYFVPTGEPIVFVDSKFGKETLTASAVEGKKFTNQKIIILINQGSASAAEIFAGVIKEYLPHVILVGDTTFGKGSVQELLQYHDGSMLKYTVAKRYMGKSKNGIDHQGIVPDFKISDDPKTSEDEQLQYVLTE